MALDGKKRREQIISILKENDTPVSASRLADKFEVSRQVIVNDIALLRASGMQIVSTARGYIITQPKTFTRVYKVRHTPEQAEEELNAIVDCGGRVKDIFVSHRVYGTIRAKLEISSRLDVQKYLKDISSGKSSALSNVTSGYHYHTVEADSEEILNLIQQKLSDMGFLAKLQDYEPVDFWDKDQTLQN